MLSCASPAVMPSAPLIPNSPWTSMLPEASVKAEPMENVEDGSFTKEQGSGFFSEGFHSASPSSKDSNEHSPRSVGSGGEPSPTFYDNVPLHAKANLGMHLDAYRNGLSYNLLTPPGFESRQNDGRNTSPTYNNYSPPRIPQPSHISAPVSHTDATPPKSPTTPNSPEQDPGRRNSFDRFHDSGFEAQQSEKNDGMDMDDGSGAEDDLDDEPGLRVPTVNSHGKVKIFKCKQCEFVAVTKLSFWEHTKEHIKPEKMLKCLKCPFVTEYKHHLEYHMRNHIGSKPFQCSQCSYSCVNKSMLNSHLKSHSNVYQYRCANCNYATKYCHSLKLHLRKYQHKPDIVLNVDGTPNPLPIIDVYGTRRGPKQKPISKMFEHAGMNNSNPQSTMQPHPIFGNHFPVNIPYLPQLLPHPFLFPPNNNYVDTKTPSRQIEQMNEKQPMLSAASILQQRLANCDLVTETRAISAPSPPPETILSVPQLSPVPPPSTSTPLNQPDDALDLTNTKTTESSTPPPVEKSAPVTPTTSLKNRRKGRAFKLQPAALRLQHDEERQREAEVSESESEVSVTPEATSVSSTNSYTCQYCDITFGDLTMHTIHMGFHGYNDPFMCNKCGERSADRIAFFIHLGRAEHS